MLEFFCRCSTCIYLLQFVKQIKRYAYGWCCVESHIGNRRWESTIYKVTVALTYQTYFLCWIRPKTLVCYGLLWPEPEETPARGYSELGRTYCVLCQMVSKPMVTKYIKKSQGLYGDAHGSSCVMEGWTLGLENAFCISHRVVWCEKLKGTNG